MDKTLLIIDEASTLKLQELSTAYSDTEEHEKNTETKIILLGDHCQLPATFNISGHQLLDGDFWHSIYPKLPEYNYGEFEIYNTFMKIIDLITSHKFQRTVLCLT